MFLQQMLPRTVRALHSHPRFLPPALGRPAPGCGAGSWFWKTFGLLLSFVCLAFHTAPPSGFFSGLISTPSPTQNPSCWGYPGSLLNTPRHRERADIPPKPVLESPRHHGKRHQDSDASVVCGGGPRKLKNEQVRRACSKRNTQSVSLLILRVGISDAAQNKASLGSERALPRFGEHTA